jgi:predicted nucleic acid-binding protein
VLFFGKGVDRDDCWRAVLALRDLCFRLVDEFDPTALTELMYGGKLTSYDAVFVNLAEDRQLPLVTADYKHHQKTVSANIVCLSELDRDDRFKIIPRRGR